MKLVYKDLLKFLSEKPSKELLSEKLFQLGHEHEIYGDVFDMELTPNRGDCLSLIGLARDLNIFFGKSEAVDIYDKDICDLKIDFENLSPSDCPRISFLEIEINELPDSYKPYLENYISTIGNNKTNLFTDISNYISYELGQPTHCYDRDNIKNKLTFENKKCKNAFKTLFGTEINLRDRNCVFISGGEIINLAGVMGGESTACSTKTKKVLVECAYFNPESVIGKSIKYNLTSDAAHKFERGVDITSHETVLRRFAKIVDDHANIKSIKLKSFGSDKFHNISIPIETNKVNKILGTNLNESEYIEYLKRLGFNVLNKIEVPPYRHDIKTNNDLAEEIARVIGYNNIASDPINLDKVIAKKINKLNQLELFLTENGFYEVINSPFTSKKEKKSINIDNPLDSNRSFIRTSIRDSLIENLLFNERRQKDSIKLFEISDIYKIDSKIKQQKNIGIIISGRLANNYNDFTKKLDGAFLDKLLNGKLNNDFFKIIQIQRSELDTKKKDKIFYVEACIDMIPDNFFSDLNSDKKNINFISFKEVSDYPISTRDFSFLITDLSIVNKVIGILNEINDEIIKHSFLFDFYKNIKLNQIKLGYRFVFQSHLKTLSDEEINKKVQDILKPILKIKGVSIPGM